MSEASGLRVVVLISGEGRNLQALIDHAAAGHLPGRIVAVISNRADAFGLQRAKAAGIATAVVPHGDYPNREAFDAALMQAIDAHAPDALVFAGFMRILTPAFTAHYQGRAINIHPSLLPRHKGLHTHAAALAAGDAEHGATVHFVTAALDGGARIIQGGFSVPPKIDASQLAERVMHEVEQKILPQALCWLLQGRVRLDGETARFDGQPLAAPLSLLHLEGPFR